MSFVPTSGFNTGDWPSLTPLAQSTAQALNGGHQISPPPGGGRLTTTTAPAVPQGNAAHAWLTLVGILVLIRVLYHFAES